eukprot:scaffold37389_cov67-Phaeocystis_antarctica.AAC.1
MSSHRSSPEVREPTPPGMRCAVIASAPFWRCCPSLCVASRRPLRPAALGAAPHAVAAPLRVPGRDTRLQRVVTSTTLPAAGHELCW